VFEPQFDNAGTHARISIHKATMLMNFGKALLHYKKGSQSYEIVKANAQQQQIK
jgi:hypothetical protein